MPKRLWITVSLLVGALLLVGCGKQATISGTVTTDGQAAAGATVVFIGPTKTEVVTNNTGKFSAAEMRQGDYEVAVITDGQVRLAQPLVVRDETVAVDLNIVRETAPSAVNLFPVDMAAVAGSRGFTMTAGTSEMEWDEQRARTGEGSLRVKGSARNHGVWLASTFVPKRNGTYTASVYVYGSPGDQIYVQFQEKGAGGTGVAKNHSGEAFTLQGNRWERIHATATFDAPDGESVGLVVRSAADANFEIWLDQFQLEEGPVPTEWQLPGVSKNLLLYNQATLEIDTRGFIGATGKGKAPALSIDRTTAWQGSGSLKIEGEGAGDGEGVWLWSAFIPDDRGTYTASLYLKGTPGDRFYMVLEEKGLAGTGKVAESTSPVFELKTSDWERHEFTATMTTGQTLGVVLRHATAQPFTVWVDGIQLESGGIATQWLSPAIPAGY